MYRSVTLFLFFCNCCITRSLGLAIPPRIRFLQRMEQRRQSSNKNTVNRAQITTNNKSNVDKDEEENSSGSDSDEYVENEGKFISQKANKNEFAFGMKC